MATLPSGPSPEIAARLKQLRDELAMKAEMDRRRQQAVYNMEKANGPVKLLTDKAKGGSAKGNQYKSVLETHNEGLRPEINDPPLEGFYPELMVNPRTLMHLARESALPLAGRSAAKTAPRPLAEIGTKVRDLEAERATAESFAKTEWGKKTYEALRKELEQEAKQKSIQEMKDALTRRSLFSSAATGAGTNVESSKDSDTDAKYSPFGDISYAKGGPIHFAIGGQGPKNWLKGSVENVIEPLKSKVTTENFVNYTPEQVEQMVGSARIKRNDAMNQWIDRNLGNYIRKQMATHDDPIRKLAEQGIVHMPPEQMGYGSSQAEMVRKKHGAPRLGQSPEAQAWEDATDVSMHPIKIKDFPKMAHRPNVKMEPWMEKADPETQVFRPLDNMHAHYLGFDHLVDILKQDIAEGRIRPEQLSKVSIEHAVRRAHEYDQERKKAMAETALKATEGMPVHKEYPEGYKWIELAMNPELPEGWNKTPAGTYKDPQGQETIHHPNYLKLEDALKYEGDTMGHCVGGYCPDVVSGKSRIFSLRDAKNEPHVTVEVTPNQHLDFNTWWGKQPKELQDEINARARRGEHKGSVYEAPEYLSARNALPPVIKQIKGKGNAKPKKDYIPYVQDFVKSGNWSDVGDLQNADLIKPTPHYLNQFYGPEDRPFIHAMEQKHGKEYWHPETIGAEYQNWQSKKAHGGIIHKAEGGNVQPSLTQMKMEIANKANPINLKNIGVNEAPGMFPKTFFPPEKQYGGVPAPGGVATPNGMPVGGIDTSQQQPGQQLMPQTIAPPQPEPQGGLPSQPPGGAPGGMPGAPEGPTPPMGNMLQMTPQGQALGAMKGPQQAMAKGGSAKSVDEMKSEMAAKAPADTGKRVTVHAEGSGGVKGIVVPRHTLEGNPKAGAVGLHEMNEARAKVYGEEHREPLTLNKIASLHKKVLAEHFAKSPEEQHEAESAALNRLREAKHIGKTANTLDESEKLDTVRHETDEQGRTHVGFASKGVAGHALYTSGHGKDTKYHVINTCPGQTEGCGGGKDAEGIVDTKKGTCFAPNAEAQYAGAAVRRAAHEQAKHDPKMTSDWILAHTGSMRNAARLADKNNQRLLFRPNVVDETDVSSRHAIRHLNEQRKVEDKPPIIANSYGKTNELHDPENGYYVTHSNVGPKVKKGESIAENIGRDKARVRNTIMAADNKGDFTNEQGNKTPPKGSYMVTDVKRGSPMAKKMESHITHAKYWTTGREEHELTPEEKAEGPEGHFGGNGKPTTPDKAHFGHATFDNKRFDYQKQHILHPRLVQVGHNKDGTPHMIPTDSRFKDEEFLPKNRFKTKNGKVAGHILMTTPTESTSNIGHQTSFTHNVGEGHIKHAMENKGEYEIDKPQDQIKAAGKEYRAPQSIKFYAEGGAVGDRHPGFGHDDFHAFPEQNVVAQRHLSMRHGEDEHKHTQLKAPVVVHKNTGTMQLEMILKKKAK